MSDFDGVTMDNIEESSLKGFADNTSVHKEVECLLKGLESDDSGEGGSIFCPPSYDTLLCWPETQAGTLATLPCFEELNGIKYDTNREYSYTVRFFIFNPCIIFCSSC